VIELPAATQLTLKYLPGKRTRGMKPVAIIMQDGFGRLETLLGQFAQDTSPIDPSVQA